MSQNEKNEVNGQLNAMVSLVNVDKRALETLRQAFSAPITCSCCKGVK